MFQEPFPTTITLPLKLNVDEELTCFVCKSKRLCELCVEVAYPGCKLWYGIHAECIEIAEKEAAKRRKFILRVQDEDAGVMYFDDLRKFEEDCKERGIDQSSDYKRLLGRLQTGKDFADATTEYRWVRVES
jgi:hypothetical protein